MAADQVLRTLQAAVEVDGRRVTLRRGDEIPEGLSDRDRQRLERRGSIVSAEELGSELANREGFKNAGESDSTAVAGASERTKQSAGSSLEDRIRDDGLNVGDTVALAGNDPVQAQAVLDAETAANDGEPRKGVEKGLKALIEG